MTADLRAPSADEKADLRTPSANEKAELRAVPGKAGSANERAAPAAGSRSDEWYTPRAILDALGPFDLDPCAPQTRPWDTAAVHFSRRDDGLSRAWFGRVWLNPPYSQGLVDRFMARMAEHGRGTALVNAATDTEWFARFVWDGATAVLFVYQRIAFQSPEGTLPKAAGGLAASSKRRDHARRPSALVAYGTDDADRLAGSGIAGAFVPLATGQTVAVIRPAGADAPDGSEAIVSWTSLIRTVVEREGGTVALEVAYVLVARHPKSAANPNWRAKVRQVLQGPPFDRVAPATYRLKLDVGKDRPRARAS